MRELIPPALLMITRLALFLSVLAWIVGHFSVAGVSVQNGHAMNLRQGWVIYYSDPNPYITMIVARELGENDRSFQMLEAVSDRSFPGVTYQRISNSSFAFQATFRHWLIVSTLTIFNVAVWWFYRKPKEVTPCES